MTAAATRTIAALVVALSVAPLLTHATHDVRFEAPDVTSLGPRIGIYTQDSPSSYSAIPGYGDTYIAASYVKLVENAGGRPVPVSYRWRPEVLNEVLESLDGFIFPGGGMDLSLNSNNTFVANARVIVDYATKKPGFPIVAICLGMQLVSKIYGGEVLSHFDAADLTDVPSWASLAGTQLAPFLSTGFTQAEVFQNHHWGVSPDAFNTSFLATTFDLLAVSKDRQGAPYVSAFESKRGQSPVIFGFQFHPEKSLYEWSPKEAIPHGFASQEVTRTVARTLSWYAGAHSLRAGREGEGRRVPRGGTDADLIYKWSPVYTQPYADVCSFTQVYFFDANDL